jgi:hypothetical protein
MFGLAISGSPMLNTSGPVAQLFPTSADFGQASVGKTSATKIVSLVNTRNQLLAMNGISIAGVNAGDFAQSNTCGPALAANANCSISVLFTPSAAGSEQATLQITDNAAASPQSAVLTGTGIATVSSVTLMPGERGFWDGGGRRERRGKDRTGDKFGYQCVACFLGCAKRFEFRRFFAE